MTYGSSTQQLRGFWQRCTQQETELRSPSFHHLYLCQSQGSQESGDNVFFEEIQGNQKFGILP